MNELDMRRAIEAKRDGKGLTERRWHEIVSGYMDGAVDEPQMAALCMACLWRGLSFEETFALTNAIVLSGETLHFDRGTVIDKHSSGGVADIVSLLAVPIAAASGARVAKLSGRALGHTGGTIDKLETIPGFNVHLSSDAFMSQVEGIGCAISSQTNALVPADKKIYALRDRTGTVPCMGLMAASIVSKKIAGGADAFVFDVKTGRGAMLQSLPQAVELARCLVEIARRFDRKASAFVTNMDEPLGRTVGTGIEVIEAREFLRCGGGDERVRELVLRVVEEMLLLTDIFNGRARAENALSSGEAYEKFVQMVESQGGSRSTLEAMALNENRSSVAGATRSGYVCAVDVVRLGNVGRSLSSANALTGLSVAVRIGDLVKAGDAVVKIYGDEKAAGNLASGFEISETAPEQPPLIYDVIRN